MAEQNKRVSGPTIEDLDAGWTDEDESVPSIDDLDAGWGGDDAEADSEEPEEPEVEEPEPPGLTAEEREARLVALAARREAARAKAVAKKERRKERRKARAQAASSKKKVKQKRTGPRRAAPPPERSAPSLRAVSRDTGEGNDEDAIDEPVRSASLAQPAHRRPRAAKPRPNWQTIGAVVALVAMLGFVAAFLLRK